LGGHRWRRRPRWVVRRKPPCRPVQRH
jgi:hypothetical protein